MAAVDRIGTAVACPDHLVATTPELRPVGGHVEPVAAGAADEIPAIGPAVQEVRAVAAPDRVEAAATGEPVATGATDELVLAAAPPDRVRPARPDELIGLLGADDQPRLDGGRGIGGVAGDGDRCGGGEEDHCAPARSS